MDVLVFVSVPQSLPAEKSSSKRTPGISIGIVVSVANGIFAVMVGGGIMAVTVGEGISVTPKGRLCQFEARKIAPPPRANNRHAPARQPTAQPADLPDLGAVLVTEPSAGGMEAGVEIILEARGE